MLFRSLLSDRIQHLLRVTHTVVGIDCLLQPRAASIEFVANPTDDRRPSVFFKQRTNCRMRQNDMDSRK